MLVPAALIVTATEGPRARPVDCVASGATVCARAGADSRPDQAHAFVGMEAEILRSEVGRER